MNRWRLILVVAAAVVVAAATALAGIALNVATGGTAAWFPTMEANYLRWLVISTVAVAGSALLAWWAQRSYDRALQTLVPAHQLPQPWVVRRPTEVTQIVRALRRRGAPTIGITTAVHGAGGFGKTIVARLVRSDRRVLRRFGGRVYWVTLGRDVRRGPALVEKVNDLVRRIDPARAQSFTDVRQAGEHLAAVLAKGPRRLIILDDVWFEDQLSAFPVTGKCARLVTTRQPSLVGRDAVPVEVDQMSSEQARRLLTDQLPHPVPSGLLDSLEATTGRWPLLLRLVNKILVDQMQSTPDSALVARELLDQLRTQGVLKVDELTGTSQRSLNIDDPEQREQAVAATIEASTGLLTKQEHSRFSELAIFVEDETIPVTLVASLWRATGGLDDPGSRALAARLADLALLTMTPTETGGVVALHDVVRDYLCRRLGAAEVRRLHQVMLDAVAQSLQPGDETTWWTLANGSRYLRDHLIEHLKAADRPGEAERVAADLRWVRYRILETGPVAPFADLATIDTPLTRRLRHLFAQIAHLVDPADDPQMIMGTLNTRTSHDPLWGRQARTHAEYGALVGVWAAPDLPDRALRRRLIGHQEAVAAVAVAPDGMWLASAGNENSVRLWDAVTGQTRGELTGHTDWVRSLAFGPKGTWLVSAGDDGTARIWDVAGRRERVQLVGHEGRVCAVAVAPDGSWVATAGLDETIRLWDVATGRQLAALAGHVGAVWSVAVSPDGNWIASAGTDQSVRVWDAGSRELTRVLQGHTGNVFALAFSGNGQWLASAGGDSAVILWDARTGGRHRKITGHTRSVRGLAFDPASRWLTSCGEDGRVRVWDAVDGTEILTLTGHTDWVRSVAVAPDGTWLASGGNDGKVLCWDGPVWPPPSRAARQAGLFSAGNVSPRTGPVTGLAMAAEGKWLATAGAEVRRITIGAGDSLGVVSLGPASSIASESGWLAVANGGITVFAADNVRYSFRVGIPRIEEEEVVAIAPDGSWLASAGQDGAIRLWDLKTTLRTATLSGHVGPVHALIIASDSRHLASAGSDGAVRIWDTHADSPVAEAGGHENTIVSLASAPGSTWFAGVGGDGDIHVWQWGTGRRRDTITGNRRPLSSVSASADGQLLVTTSVDRTVQVWSLESRTCAASARVEKPLSCSLWSRSGHTFFVGGEAGVYHFEVMPPRAGTPSTHKSSACADGQPAGSEGALGT